MGLLSKAYKRLKYLSRTKSACKKVVSDASSGSARTERPAAEASDLATRSADVAVACTSLRELERADITAKHSSCRPTGDCWTPSGCFSPEPVAIVTELSSRSCELGVAGLGTTACAAAADVQMLSSARGGDPGVHNMSSESDSGVCLSECEPVLQEEDEAAGECDDDEYLEDEYECECEECAFAMCEHVLEDWHISAKELALDKVLSGQPGETVYSGYWHGSVTVHKRQSAQQADLNFYIREAHMLSKIRHENIQLFLGVCLDMLPESVALVMSDVKGESLHSLVHKKGQEFQFAAMTKYINQIAQGMAYLHDRGIAHPLLTSKCISIHYRVCISMLSPAFCSNSVDPSQLVYLPPEVIRTLHPTPAHPSTHHSNSLSTDPTNQDSTDANIFSFGTIVYEMVTMKRPFPATPGELIIWEVGSGRCQPLHHMNSGKLKDIVQRCWSPCPEYRPSFKALLSTLEQNMSPRACGLNSYFSFSDPGQLARAGLR